MAFDIHVTDEFARKLNESFLVLGEWNKKSKPKTVFYPCT